MQIQTEQDMKEFCETARFHTTFNIVLQDSIPEKFEEMEKANKEMVEQQIIGQGSHIQQGIAEILYTNSHILLTETPYLYPSGKLLENYPELTGPMTGNLSNCYDTQTKRFLFHMRGRDISAPFGFQAAAAGMGIYGQHPSTTAALELYQEAGLEKFRQFPRNGLATDVLPFMKAGKIPQPLFSFGFLDDLSRFQFCQSLDDIAEFEASVKRGLADHTLKQKEAYHFTLHYEKVEDIAGELNDKQRFYGPIYDSTINFIRTLRDKRVL